MTTSLPVTPLAAPVQRLRGRVRSLGRRLHDEAEFCVWSVATGAGRANAELLTSLRGKFSGKRCFVMGNGPSLLKSDLNRLAAEITIVSNAHYLIWPQLNYVPTLLAVEDCLVAEDRSHELRMLDGITKIFPFDLRSTLVPVDNNTAFVLFPREYEKFPRFSHDLRRRAYWGGTVSYLNLQLAAYLGCDPIVLLGFDHDYKVPDGEVVENVIHSRKADVNHIHPDYFGPGYRWHDPNVARMEIAFEGARAALQRKGTRVLNATVGGKLEVFDRISLAEVLDEAR